MNALICCAVNFLSSILIDQLVPICHLTVLGERDDGRRGARALRVRDDRGLAAFENRDDGVGRPEVYAYRSCHVSIPCCVVGLGALPAGSSSGRKRPAKRTKP